MRLMCALVLGGAACILALPVSSAVAEPASKPRDPAAEVTDLDARCKAAAEYSTRHSGRVMLVMVDGREVFARADNGWSLERAHPLASGTKSFVGVVAMKAVEDGLLTLDELACDTLTEWKSDPKKSKITVRHLLTLSSGLDPADALLGGRGGARMLGEGAARRAKRLGPKTERPKDLFQAGVDVPSVAEPGAKFAYGPSHFYAFGELLERKLEARATADPKWAMKTYDAYMHAKVLDPIGLKVAFFGLDSKGHPALPGGCLLAAREWAKLGQLVLQKGEWADAAGARTSVVSWDLLKQCFEPSAANASYGLTWWLPMNGNAEASLIADGPLGDRIRERVRDMTPAPAVGADGKVIEVWMAAGLGKQRLYVIPAYKMVVVRFAEATTKGRGFDDRAFLRPLLEARGE